MEPSQLLDVRQQIQSSRITDVEPIANAILACKDTDTLHQQLEQLNTMNVS